MKSVSRLAVAVSWVAAMSVAASVAWAAASKAPAAAASKTADITGKIHSVDVVNEVITLEDGKYYMIPDAIKLDGYKAGDQVKLSVNTDDKGKPTNRATALSKAN